MNGDGHLDLASANARSGDVSVLFGNGDGTFQNAVHCLVGVGISFQRSGGPESVQAADMDGDGGLDLFAVSAAQSAVLVNRGDGTFDAPRNFATGEGPLAATAADFDSDGALDLAVANEDSEDVWVFLNAGDGSLRLAETVSLPENPSSLTTADLDADGTIDLAVSTDAGFFSVLFGDGDGTFADPVHVSSGDLDSLSAADLDGDGRIGLAAANRRRDRVEVFLNDGNGGFAEPANS